MDQIRIPTTLVAAVVAHAYNLSRPQGLGFMHYTPEPMTLEEAQQVVDAGGTSFGHTKVGVSLDYVNGRAVKLHIREDVEGYFLEDDGTWFDHGPTLWAELKRLIATDIANCETTRETT